MAPDPKRYSGYRLSEIQALGRTHATLVCPRCDVRRTYLVTDLIDRLGDEILPSALDKLTPRCPTRDPHGYCSAVYAEPLTGAEEVAIKAMRRSGESPYPVLG